MHPVPEIEFGFGSSQLVYSCLSKILDTDKMNMLVISKGLFSRLLLFYFPLFGLVMKLVRLLFQK